MESNVLLIFLSRIYRIDSSTGCTRIVLVRRGLKYRDCSFPLSKLRYLLISGLDREQYKKIVSIRCVALRGLFSSENS